MRIIIVFCLSACFAFFADAQKVDKLPKNPDEKITVNKEYDENGNLISYDSTYVNSWSSDSSMVFPYNGEEFFSFRSGFPNIDKFMQQFFGDIPFNDPFIEKNDDLTKNFRKRSKDSTWFNHSPFLWDSIPNNPFSDFWFKSDPFGSFGKDFGKNFEELRKQMEKNNQWFAMPDSIPGNHFYQFNEPFMND